MTFGSVFGRTFSPTFQAVKSGGGGEFNRLVAARRH